MAEKKYPRSVISILVENHYGVLARIASMFNRRSFNIDSIAASETIDPGITRITITVHADQNTLKQMLLQTERLEEVKKADDHLRDKRTCPGQQGGLDSPKPS